ncbi:MAG: hypothetical protein R8G66_24090 [Cytophagales bacterium]|nr:hypothetical protein [Cytophagales bacterium]
MHNKALTLFLFSYLLCLPSLKAQIDPGDFVTIPKSPEAAAFSAYGNQPISMFTGASSVSVPIGSVSGRSLAIPVSLTYGGGGIKVEQLATEVGLGWNLRIGGMVTKEVRGLPDHYITGSHYTTYSPDPFPQRQSSSELLGDFSYQAYFELFKSLEIQRGDVFPANDNLIEDFLQYRDRVIKREIDTQVDLYSINVLNVSAKVYIDYDFDTGNPLVKKAMAIDDPTLDVEVTFASNGTTHSTKIASWKVRDANGNTYIFNHAETTESFDDSSDFIDHLKHNSAWYVSQIISGDKRDTFNFSYLSPTPWSAQQPALKRAIYTDWHNNAPTDPDCKAAETYTMNSQINYVISQPFLNKIRRNNKDMLELKRQTNDRKDLAGRKAVEEIIIKDLTSQNTLQRCELKYSYAGPDENGPDWESRLLLDEVQLFAASSANPQKYTFEYKDRNSIPSRTSNAQDYWGFYNGWGGNNLFPKNSDYDDASHLTGVNRESRVAYATVGMLSKVTYPTGGYTEFSYQLPWVSGSQLVENRKYLGRLTVSGGETAGTYCDDGVLGIPNSATDNFRLTQSGTYTVEISVTGSNFPVQTAPLYFAALTDASGVNGDGNDYCDFVNNSAIVTEFREDGAAVAVLEQVTLGPGIYNMLLVNNIFGVTITMDVYEETTSTVNLNVGAPRVYKTLDYEATNALAKTTYYYYGDLSLKKPSEITKSFLESNAASSAQLHQPRLFERIYEPFGDCQYLQRYANNQATPTPNVITYSTVSQVDWDETNADYNGVSVTYFENRSEAQSIDPYINYHQMNGRVTDQSIYRKDTTNDIHAKVEEVANEYSVEYIGEGFHGFWFKQLADIDNRDIMIVQADNTGDHVFFDYVDWLEGDQAPCMWVGPGCFTRTSKKCWKPWWGGTSAICNKFLASNPAQFWVNVFSGVGNTQYEGEICTSNVSCFRSGPMPIHQQRTLASSRYFIKLNRTLTTSYDDDGNPLNQVTQYVYDPSVSYQVRSKSVFNSLGDEITETFKYPADLSETELLANHRIAEVLESNVTNGQTSQLSRKVEFGSYGNYHLPDRVLLGRSSSEREERIQLDYETTSGNLIEVVRDGLKTIQLWSYDGTMQVASITDYSYAQLTTDLNAISSSISNLESQTSTATIESILSDLRNEIPDHAIMTTYLYDPGIGISKQIDPNGLIITYHYDDFHRLYQVKDQDQNILKEYKYNYSN